LTINYRRQKREVPFIVTACVREVERRGMAEIGIYRVSGSASDLGRLKKSFETSECHMHKMAVFSYKRKILSGVVLLTCLLSRNVNAKIYETIILPVLYGCETLSLTLREEHRLRVFENSVLRRIFGPKRDEVMGEWRKLHIICTHLQILLGRSSQGE
jgi:hypothetical protein